MIGGAGGGGGCPDDVAHVAWDASGLHIFCSPLPLPPLHVMPAHKLEYPIPRRRTLSDPLTAALLPPPDESPSAREHRLKAEIDAKKVSDSIDDMLRQERSERKRSKPEVTVLLLGQSESGKSTTLKRESPGIPGALCRVCTYALQHILSAYSYLGRVHTLPHSICIPYRGYVADTV